MAQPTILIVDDEKDIIDLIEIYLRNEGYRLLRAANGLEALSVLEKEDVDLIVLDIMMPKMDGIEACLKIRESRNMPIIMLSAKSQDMDKILGLGTGADDYMTKPFNPLELIARIKSQLRRYTRLNVAAPSREHEIEVDDLTINTATHEVKLDGREIKLTPREFAILELLARNRGTVWSIERIYETVWKETYLDSDNTVMVHIRKIREKIEDNPRKPRFIKTVWGVGYKVE
ncbi:response regulator transcription factor [Paenibacillus mucilaginosus]|uniref:Two-component response regulator n=2 Tax=Paenibacillus mucilaginosus TaxID=61624 RepID=H6NBF4_9BACL|nr:response regulator transcription factor [Paenibacillus mucilaginosus]AEI45156.1 two-component response regulator [Paenibacillus mucilaginosus KNP414]AFC32900.1 two-component response regulator [Paenibacillus mucilaginosus 3016]MCG7212950.1 response regulator transcription factor [Paenibacillus mucilaginosus]WDM26637.1 response regulator transcription factor [Paenibacillus mucilaginosus]WFA21351.1 response regulator transcription factor [Paenibacillus mucilaginosus]